MSTLPISRRVLLACAGLALVPAFATAGDNENEAECAGEKKGFSPAREPACRERHGKAGC